MRTASPRIEVRDLPEPTEEAFAPARSAGPALDYREFTGAIARDWRISSFTSLTANQARSCRTTTSWALAAGRNFPPSGIFAFPGGAKPGTCLHKILEKLDFPQWDQPATSDLVREQLRVHGLPEAEFTEVIVEMLGKVMTAPLDERVPGLTLEKLSAAQRLHELEFYFPLQRIAPQMIWQAAAGTPLLRATTARRQREPEGLLVRPGAGDAQGLH